MNHLIRRGDLWEPFGTLRNLQEEMDRLMERPLRSSHLLKGEETFFAPDIDVKDEKDEVIVRADIPGIKKDELNISVQDDILTVKGERKEEQEKKGKDYYYAERFHGTFSRAVELPSKVRATDVKASYKDGVVEIHLPKDATAKPREVKIQIQ